MFKSLILSLLFLMGSLLGKINVPGTTGPLQLLGVVCIMPSFLFMGVSARKGLCYIMVILTRIITIFQISFVYLRPSTGLYILSTTKILGQEAGTLRV